MRRAGANRAVDGWPEETDAYADADRLLRLDMLQRTLAKALGSIGGAGAGATSVGAGLGVHLRNLAGGSSAGEFLPAAAAGQ